MNILRSSTVVCLAVVAVTAGVAQAVEATESAKKKTTVEAYVDCEDTDFTPCVTYDEGRWIKVLDFDPVMKVKRVSKPIGSTTLPGRSHKTLWIVQEAK